MEQTFLEKIWILFISAVFVEWIIKDLIIFYDNPNYVNEINEWIISDWLNKQRNIWWKKSFNDELLKEFFDRYDKRIKDKSIKDLLSVIRYTRDIFWHCRISSNEQTLRYIPNQKSKFNSITKLFKIKKWIWDTITINNFSLNYEEKIKAVEIIDHKIFPKIAKTISLEYENIR
jgi:hypothetical protein